MEDNSLAATATPERSGIGRRSVLAAAWSVPAISVLAAAPALAASPVAVPIVEATDLTVTRDNKDVTFQWSFKSNVEITSVSLSTTVPSTGDVQTVNAPSFTAAALDGAANVPSFTGKTENNGQTIAIDAFNFIVSFTYNGTIKSATFTSVSTSLSGKNASTTITVSPASSNPTT